MLKTTHAVAWRPRAGRWLAAAAGLALGLSAALPARADDTIKVGILHSLSGTMAISETTLKDVMLMLIEEQNKKGGVLGKKLEAVVVDPASNWPLFAEKARELISKDKVAVVFGCWTSVSRKSVLPVFKELDSILFYPVQYEGEESERNVFYTGAAPNQQAIPAVDYLMGSEGGSVKRWVLEGTDYVYPRTTNKILEAYLKQKGVKDEDIMINYTPFGFADWQTEVSKIKAFGSAGKKTAVVSTINGDANVPFYKELGNQGLKATAIWPCRSGRRAPATLSPVALQGWLRRRLGFDGVIITDDLEMGGITTSLSAPQGAQEALAAGADLLLICNNWQAAWETARLLAMDASLAPRGQEAAARLNSLRRTLGGESVELPAVREYFAR